jgi:hypothetical protein
MGVQSGTGFDAKVSEEKIFCSTLKFKVEQVFTAKVR